MWGGRFADGPSAIMREINASIPFDKALWRQDIAGSKAHVAMLGAAGHHLWLTMPRRSMPGWIAVAAEYERDGVPEDLGPRRHPHDHRSAAGRADRAGQPGGSTPRAAATIRSRPISACGCAMPTCAGADAGLDALQRALVARAAEHADSIMPGFTHLQTAQPVTLGHHLMAYYEMLRRDRAQPVRDAGARKRMSAGAVRRWPARASRSIGMRPRQRSALIGRRATRSMP
jgi:argininosuccinate lyase